MRNWQPSDILVLLITILVVAVVMFAVGAVYLGVPFDEGRAKAMASLFDSLIAIIAMYLGSKLKE